ncbi:hypothetical protein GOL81_31115 [Sinorhizobium medicae]|nr:hypothetical protein [Sinorhizobium medicae]MDX0519111.1 hypothetical protein [Sinorhizobium medicae]MDX0568230.1 hypothetical protein [Sinorhizobium medicae]MDX0580869.1 hypothetical protein [Sinorhizobium medicae]MDX0729516.1 hypothetical protein [Sinorhizobium medicae]
MGHQVALDITWRRIVPVPERTHRNDRRTAELLSSSSWTTAGPWHLTGRRNSPDLNPIENASLKLKALLRARAERSVDALLATSSNSSSGKRVRTTSQQV